MYFFRLFGQHRAFQMGMLKWTIAFLSLLTAYAVTAQSVKLSGRIATSQNESLPSALIIAYPDSVSRLSDNDGRFSVNITPGKVTLHVSFVGYEPVTLDLTVNRDTVCSIQMREKLNELNTIT